MRKNKREWVKFTWWREMEEIRAERGGEDLTWHVPCALCAWMSESAKAYAHLTPHIHLKVPQPAHQHLSWLGVLVRLIENLLLLGGFLHVCTCVYLAVEQQIRLGQPYCRLQCVYCMCVCVWMLPSISPGQEDTGISRDELLIEEAVIEVFKKVRGD